MACHLCEENEGMHFCNRCNYPMCIQCAKRVLKEKDECPQCKNTLKINYFMAGKIKDSIKNGVSINKNIIVHDDRFDDDLPCWRDLEQELGIKTIVYYNDYINLKKPLPTIEYDLLTNITGPCVIIKDLPGYGYFSHGKWCDDNFTNILDIPNIVNSRNLEMIKSCDVFSLKINNNNDCFRSFVEWGIAVALRKIPILIIDNSNPSLPEHYLKASESIEILETLSEERRNAIFHCHPDLNMTYGDYKRQMERINILKKKSNERRDDGYYGYDGYYSDKDGSIYKDREYYEDDDGT